MANSQPPFELVGVGSPIMDLLARVPDDFLVRHVPGAKGGMVLVDGVRCSFRGKDAGSADSRSYRCD